MPACHYVKCLSAKALFFRAAVRKSARRQHPRLAEVRFTQPPRRSMQVVERVGRVRILALGLLFAQLLFLSPTEAFMCPPETEQKEARLEGEECGGFCGQRGICAKGLACETPLMKSGLPTGVVNALSFNSAGKCVKIGKEADPLTANTLVKGQEENKSPRRRLNGPVCAGCPTSRDPKDEDVVTAAKAAIELKNAAQEAGVTGGRFSYVRVVEAATQVVSGIKYILVVEVERGTSVERYDVEVVNQPWKDPKWALSKWQKEEGQGR